VRAELQELGKVLQFNTPADLSTLTAELKVLVEKALEG